MNFNNTYFFTLYLQPILSVSSSTPSALRVRSLNSRHCLLFTFDVFGAIYMKCDHDKVSSHFRSTKLWNVLPAEWGIRRWRNLWYRRRSLLHVSDNWPALVKSSERNLEIRTLSLSGLTLANWKFIHLSNNCSGVSLIRSSIVSPSWRSATSPGAFCRVILSNKKRWKK